tara:strand:- start:268 stop:891 length:624 start_codon:yes stop_codon:yes gene_type:complete
MKKYIIYRTTNTVNNKEYTGYHSTEDLNDGYLGSGKILEQAIQKYGKDKFIKEILYEYDNREDALAKEKEIVTAEYVDRPETYNLKIGGEGGFDYLQKDKTMIAKRIAGIRKSVKEGRHIGWKQRWADGTVTGKSGVENGFYGKTHSDEARRKIKENNAMTLTEEVVQQRLQDVHGIGKSWGYVTKLGKMWGVSHTQVRRFLKKYNQ